MSAIESILQILGGIGLFLYGMKTMSDGLQKAAGDRLQKTIHFMTKNRFTGLLTGIGVTSVIQSSSAMTVMVVSFVGAGMLTLTQSIGVIMGANIGTTLTAWAVSLLGFKMKISAFALPAIGMGLPLFFIKKFNKIHFGEFLIGFGILFLGLHFIKDAMPAIDGDAQIVWDIVTAVSGSGLLSHLAFIAIGMVLTIIVQSSTATVAIVQVLAFQGWLDFESAVAIVLGENVGTTATAQLAAVGGGLQARRAAMVHTMFNVIGIIWMLCILPFFIKFTDTLFGGALLVPVEPGNAAMPTAIAFFHSMFSVLNTVVLIWFVPQFEYLIRRILPDKKQAQDSEDPYRIRHYALPLKDTPDMNIVRARQEVQKMAKISKDMFTKFIGALYNLESDIEEVAKDCAAREELTDQMQSELSRFLGECSRYNLSDSNRTGITILIRIIDELESIADSSYRLVMLEKKCRDRQYVYDVASIEETKPYTDLIQKFLDHIAHYLERGMTSYEFYEAKEMERQINEYRNTLKRAARSRIEQGGSVSGEILFIDVLQQMEHIGDYAFNIARAISGMR